MSGDAKKGKAELAEMQRWFAEGPRKDETYHGWAMPRKCAENVLAYVRGLERALEPFASEAAKLASSVADDCVFRIERHPDCGLSGFDVGDLRRARAASEGEGQS